MPSDQEEAYARFAHLGAAQVKQLMNTGGLPPAWNVHAIHWLAEKDKEAGREDPMVRGDDVGSAKERRKG